MIIRNEQSRLKNLLENLLSFHSNQTLSKKAKQSIYIEKRINVTYDALDLEHLNKIISLKNFSECLKKFAIGRFGYGNKWNEVWAVFSPRDGKSIFNTRLVESYHQHFAENPPGCQKIPLTKAFVSHFRDLSFAPSSLPIRQIFVDIEFNFFLNKHCNHFGF